MDILEQVLGVEIGGWDFSIPLPGIDADVHVGYSLILAIASTEDVRTNQTPACITNSSNYHGDRLDRFLEPSSFNSTINNYLESRGVHEEGLLVAYNEGLMLLDSWSDSRYAFVNGFGWFDARHGTLGFGIGFNYSGEGSVAVFESIWESLQERFLGTGGCTSAFIREDIYSNHVGARAGEAYHADRKTPASI